MERLILFRNLVALLVSEQNLTANYYFSVIHQQVFLDMGLHQWCETLFHRHN